MVRVGGISGSIQVGYWRNLVKVKFQDFEGIPWALFRIGLHMLVMV